MIWLGRTIKLERLDAASDPLHVDETTEVYSEFDKQAIRLFFDEAVGAGSSGLLDAGEWNGASA